jgi:hypothetical protein
MADWSRTALMVGVVLILITVTLELVAPHIIKEGFATALIPVTDRNYFGKFIPRRGDIGSESEEGAYITDKRYFNGYADVQRIGVEHDWCRMVVPKGGSGSGSSGSSGSRDKDRFFACALAGTENLNSLSFRTEAGTLAQWSRDDYMRDTTGSGRSDYCRIVKVDSETFETRCSIAGDFRFGPVLQQDTAPPPEIQTLLSFYDGILFWLRFRDDMLDYAQNLELYKAGGITIEEANPSPPIARTLVFNGIDQFLRVGDSKTLEFGENIALRTLRAFSFWVYFEEFTNNAVILDFGNGAAKDNIKIGILGRGNPNISEGAEIRPLLCGGASTIPDKPSGPQRVVETTPQRLMETTSANVEEFDCPGPAVSPREFPPMRPGAKQTADAKVADLLYEIWDSQQRKMRIVVKGAIPLQKWTHVVITAESNDAFRPDIAVWIDGVKVFVQPSGWLPQNSSTTNNYIGKSNSYNLGTQYEAGRDELFRGRLFDLRAYKSIMGAKRIAETVKWGKDLLGLGAGAGVGVGGAGP